MKLRVLVLVHFLILINIGVFAQEETFRDQFEEANVLLDDKFYGLALPVWLKLQEQDTENANLSYKVGLCYFNSTEKSKALPYFEKAITNITKNYDRFHYLEKRAPFESYYYLARTYHINYQLNKAIELFGKFKEMASKKHYLLDDINHQVQMCLNAKELIGAPVEIIKTNLGAKVNSKYPEYSPIITLDESTLFFTSRRLRKDSSNVLYKEIKDGGFFEDIYVSYKDENGEWGEPKLLNINEPSEHYATIGLSADGQTLYIYIDDEGDGNLYQSFLVGDRWTTPELIGIDTDTDINTEFYETHMTVSANGKTLYFVSDRKGGFGGLDIYRCVKLPNGEWSLAQNLGPTINTQYNEDGPFIHPDGVHLFFSSQGHKSIGGYDIFFSELREDGTWTQPYNIGYPINTTDDDVFYITSPDGKRAYYSSFQEEGGYGEKDLYLLERTDVKEAPLTLLKGHIAVPEGQELPDNIEIIVTDNETGEQVSIIKPIRRTGSYVIIIPPGKNYNIAYFADEKEFYNENVYIPLESQYQEINKEIFLNPVKLGTGETGVVVVRDIKPDTTKKPETKRQWQLRYLTLNNDLPEGLTVHYLDDNGKVLFSETIGKDGYFEYKILDPDQVFIFTLEPKDQVLCEDLEIVMVDPNENLKIKLLADNKCIFRVPEVVVDDGKVKGVLRHKYIKKIIPDSMVIQFLDENGNVVITAKIDKDGFFRYTPLPKDMAFIVKLTPQDAILCDEYEIELATGEGGISIVLNSDNECNFKETKEKFITKEIAFTHYFRYNSKDIDPGDPKYVLLIDSIMALGEARGYIDISVEASASTVPTRTFSNNEEIAKLRAKDGKKQLVEILVARGLAKSKINFVNTTTMVTGPKYKNDYLKNRHIYEKFQYLKLFIAIKYQVE